MVWNWQQPDWPHFSYDATRLEGYESQFLKGEGLLWGAFKYLNEEDKSNLKVEIISTEALKHLKLKGNI